MSSNLDKDGLFQSKYYLSSDWEICQDRFEQNFWFILNFYLTNPIENKVEPLEGSNFAILWYKIATEQKYVDVLELSIEPWIEHI